jgi:hypothetical protein
MSLIAALVLAQAAPSDPFEGLWKPVDLDLQECGIREAFETLFRLSGISLELPEKLDEKKITLQLQQAPFWKAFDEICKAHGNVRPLRRIDQGRKSDFEEGAWIDRPAFYQGPLRLHLYEIARVRELRAPGRRDRTDVGIVLSWAPTFTPVVNFMQVAGELRWTRVQDDKGKSLLPEVAGDNDFDFSVNGQYGLSACAWLRRLQGADPEATRIAVLEGEWEGSFLTDLEEIVFDRPMECVGQSRKAGPVVVTLTGVSPSPDPLEKGREGTWEIRFSLAVDPSATDAWKEGLKQVPLERRTLWQASARGKNDTVRKFMVQPMRGSTVVGTEIAGSLWRYGNAPTSLSITVAKGMRSGKFAFSFQDLKLP